VADSISFKGKPIFFDAGDFAEDTRIRMIGETATNGAETGFMVEDDAKADRYVKKLLERFPLLEVHYRGPGLAGTVLVRVGRKEGLNG
jgi:hypothetical protein